MEMSTCNALLSTSYGFGKKIKADEIIADTRPALFRSADKSWNAFQNRRSTKNYYENCDWISSADLENDLDAFRILLIGDEHNGQGIRITLSATLNLKMEYLEAKSGNLALDIIGREAVDLIIFGGGIIDMDGLDFLDRLNRKFGKHKIPVIEILGVEAAKGAVQAMRMGAHDYLVRDSAGQYFEMLPILVSRIYAEQQTMNLLRKNTNVQQTLTDNTPSVIYLLSLQGGRHDVRISPQILELGLSSDKWGNDAELHHQMCHVDDRPIVRKALEYSYKTGTNFQCEYRINILGDTLRWFHDRAKVVMDKYGRPLFLQGVMTDITNVKLLEDEITRYRGMLEKMVSQRTEMLDRRIAILESCNSSLSESYEKMRRTYLNALLKVKDNDANLNIGNFA